MKRLWRLLPAILLGIAAIPAVAADPVADFYHGKTITLVISVGEGDGMDRTARILARHWPDTIPGNPTIIAKNMPGAGSLRATEYLYTQAPKDGTVLGALIPVFVLQQAMGGGTAGSINYDAAKFGWIGSSNTSNQMVYVWHTAGVETLQQAMEQELLMGATGAGSNSVLYPTILNNVLGTRFKIIMGYRAAPEIGLAMERGEVQGRCGWSWSSVKSTHQKWIDDKQFSILVQLALEKHPDLPDVPLVIDLAKTDEQRKILRLIFARQVMGRPFLAPPGIPADRAAALRKAFMDTMTDKDFLADTEKAQMEINPVSGEKLTELVTEIYATPKELADQAAAFIARK
jgi:tripartite-type tricarboxylate transporter receptor subunit TctC